MRKYLALAVVLLTGCSERVDVVDADSIELIHVDAVSQRLNLTVVGADGKRRTIAFTPDAAVQAQEAMARTLLLTVESAEALNARPQSQTPDQ